MSGAGHEGSPRRGTIEPPPAESPVWLPSLAQPKAVGRSVAAPGGTLLKAKNYLAASTLKAHGGNAAALFSMDTLPDVGALETKKKKKHTIPKLPSIEKSQGQGVTGKVSTKHVAALNKQQQQRGEGEEEGTARHSEVEGFDDGEDVASSAGGSQDEHHHDLDEHEAAAAHAHPVDDGSYDPDMIPGIGERRNAGLLCWLVCFSGHALCLLHVAS